MFVALEAGDVGGLPGYNGQGLDANGRLGSARVLPNLPLEGPPDRGGSLVGQLRRLSESLERQEPPRKGTEPPCCKGYFDRIRLKVSYLDHFCFCHIAPLAHQNDRKPVLYAGSTVRPLLVFFFGAVKNCSREGPKHRLSGNPKSRDALHLADLALLAGNRPRGTK